MYSGRRLFPDLEKNAVVRARVNRMCLRIASTLVHSITPRIKRAAIRVDFKTDPTAVFVACDCYLAVNCQAECVPISIVRSQFLNHHLHHPAKFDERLVGCYKTYRKPYEFIAVVKPCIVRRFGESVAALSETLAIQSPSSVSNLKS